MGKENVLFSLIGLLLGVIITFVVTNHINQKGYEGRQHQETQNLSSTIPAGHPQIPSGSMARASGSPPPEVQAVIQKAKDEPNNFEAQMKAAELFYRIERYSEALDYLTHANQIRPDNYETVVALGNVNFDAHHFDAAEKWYLAALTKNPKDISVRTDLGTTLLQQSPPQTERAIQEFRRSLEINPSHEQTLQNLVLALSLKGNTQEAQAFLAKLESVNPQNPSLSDLRANIEQSSLTTESKVGRADSMTKH